MAQLKKINLVAEVVERRNEPGIWVVEAETRDGAIIMAVFSGPKAKVRAVEYASARFRTVHVGALKQP